jgi:hypothetical protein
MRGFINVCIYSISREFSVKNKLYPVYTIYVEYAVQHRWVVIMVLLIIIEMHLSLAARVRFRAGTHTHTMYIHTYIHTCCILL